MVAPAYWPTVIYMGDYRTDIFVSEPMADYRAKRPQYLTSHQLADYRACPLLYRKAMAGSDLRPFTVASFFRVNT